MMVADGHVRYALVGAVSSHKHGGEETIGTWVTETCQIVPSVTYESGSTGRSPTEDPGHMLYDSSSHATKARLSVSSKPNRSWAFFCGLSGLIRNPLDRDMFDGSLRSGRRHRDDPDVFSGTL